MGSMVGMMCFLHGWFWHSMHFFIALAAKPSCLVMMNENLKIPVLDYICHANSQKFAYPPRAESKKDKDVKKIETVVLSITGKKNASKKLIAEEKKRREAAASASSAAAAPSSSSTSGTAPAAEDEKMEVDQPGKSK